MRTFLAIIFLGLFFLEIPSQIKAQVLISEVHPAPTDGVEWVELVNLGLEPINLENWWLEDQLASPSLIHTFGSLVLESQTWLKVELASAKLNNTADGVSLKNYTGDVINAMSYNTTQLGKSWSWVPESNGLFLLSDPSPGSANPLPPPSPTPQPSPQPTPSPLSTPTPTPPPVPTPAPSIDPNSYALQLSEIMACPNSSDTEWLELFNPASNSITLSNWVIKDSGTTTKNITLTIPAGSFAVATWTGSLLNNTGDSLNLISPTGQIIATATLTSCSPGQSFIWYEGNWNITSTPTKGLPNQTPATDGTETENEKLALQTDSVSTEPEFSSNLQESQGLLPASTSAPSPTTASAALYFDPPINHPPPPITNLAQPTGTKWGVINVILGGVFLLSAAGNLLHENRNYLA